MRPTFFRRARGRRGPPVSGLLSNVATLHRDSVPTNLNQTNIQPVYDIYASAQGRDLGSISDEIGKIVAGLQKQLKPGNTIQVMGQIQSMRDSFRDLGIGLLFAAVFVYLLMVVNYQNFADPFVVILALPATLSGIMTMLFITGTTRRRLCYRQRPSLQFCGQSAARSRSIFMTPPSPFLASSLSRR